MTQEQIYQNIAQRTGGDIYIGVVGPVRSGKSTLIKRFAELMLLPHIQNEAQRARATDELPQSAAGRTIMTTEPKFIPEKAGGNPAFRRRQFPRPAGGLCGLYGAGGAGPRGKQRSPPGQEPLV